MLIKTIESADTLTKINSHNRWFVAGNPAYALTHLLPLAHAHARRFGRPLTALSSAVGALRIDSLLVQMSNLGLNPVGRLTAVCLDIPTLIKMRLLGFRCVLLYHSMIGKGKMFRGERPFWPQKLASHIILPMDEQCRSLPIRLQPRAYACGHLPNDWLSMPEFLLQSSAIESLALWRASKRPRVLFVSTRGSPDIPKLVSNITEWLPCSDATLAVKWHPADSNFKIPSHILNVFDVPVPILAMDADSVIGDHSSSLFEAQSAGASVAVIDTSLLKRLRALKPPLWEVSYVDRDIQVLSGSDDVARFIGSATRRAGDHILCQAFPSTAGEKILTLLEEIT